MVDSNAQKLVFRFLLNTFGTCVHAPGPTVTYNPLCDSVVDVQCAVNLGAMLAVGTKRGS